jgi:hypothetical protein
VRERGNWRVVMRSEQIAAFTTGDDEADADSTREPNTSTGDLDCDDFDYQEDAQAVYEQDTTDPNGLDDPVGEGYTGEEGEACEDLPNRVSAQPPAQKSQSPRPQSVAPRPNPTPAPLPPSAPEQPTPRSGADCSSGVSNVPVIPGSKGDGDGDGIACEK